MRHVLLHGLLESRHGLVPYSDILHDIFGELCYGRVNEYEAVTAVWQQDIDTQLVVRIEAHVADLQGRAGIQHVEVLR